MLPGATRYGLLPILERHAGRAAGADLRVCYSPEFIALGSVIRDFLNPDFLLIGEFDRASGDHLEACYRDIIGPTPVRRMTLENAELAKMAVNAFVTTKITFANMLADLCARIPNGDVDVVADAIGLDTRIGRKYLSGGLGFGGPCFPRDNAALGFVASALGACPDLPIAVDRINRSSAERILDLLTPRLMRTSTVGVLGLAYKPLSQVIEESQAMIVVRALLDRGIQVVAYDPLAGRAADLELGGRARVVDSVRACVCDADVVLIATPDPEFQSLTADDFPNGSRVLVVDFWRILGDRLTNQPRIDYWPVRPWRPRIGRVRACGSLVAVMSDQPYLSVVVASRNDTHGGDPLARLQALVNSFGAQCHRFGLDAELIVVEWNPPPDRPRLRDAVRVPSPCGIALRLWKSRRSCTRRCRLPTGCRCSR